MNPNMDLYSYRGGHGGGHPGGGHPGGGHPGGGGGTMQHHAEKSEAMVAKYSIKYMRQSRSVAILWAVFAFCSAILNVVVFLSEEWIGATDQSKSPGHFGLWKFCIFLTSSAQFAGEGGVFPEPDIKCIGSLENFSSILSPAFRASTVFVGLAVLMSILCIVAMLLFCFMEDQSVYEICATIQGLQGICMVVGILCFPAGWDNDNVRGICGKEADDYALGLCGIRWAFVMAFICVIDAFILCTLAIVLSNRNVEPITLQHNPSPYFMGEVNGGYISDSQSLAGSRKSLAMQNVMMVPHMQMAPPPTPGGTLPPPEQYSDGQGGPHQGVPPPYGSYPNMQNFQL